MKVWVTVTRREVQCSLCNKTIELDQYQVVCSFFVHPKGVTRTWTLKKHYHAEKPNCYLEQAKIELAKRPHIETRGKKPLQLSDERKTKREKILRRRGSALHRIKMEMESLGRPGKILRLTEQLSKLAAEIEPYGGVPKSWQ